MSINLQSTEEFTFARNDIEHTKEDEEFAKKICISTKKEQEKFCEEHNENSTKKETHFTTKDDIIIPILDVNK